MCNRDDTGYDAEGSLQTAFVLPPTRRVNFGKARIFSLFSGKHVKIASNNTVQRQLLKFGAASVLAFCVWGHVSELFDHWDNTFRTGNDIEYSTVIVAVLTGAVICFAYLALVLTESRIVAPSLLRTGVSAATAPAMVSPIAHSPPVPLRI